MSKPNIADAFTANIEAQPVLTQSSAFSAPMVAHSPSVQHQSSNDSDNAVDRRSGEFSDAKKFWESLDSQRDESPSCVAPPVPKPRSQVSSMGSSLLRTEESLENTSLRELSQSSSRISSEQQVEYSESSSNADARVELARDDDSIIAEDRLEDESFPVSDRFDSEGEARIRVDQEFRLDSLEYDNERRVDSVESDQEKSGRTSAYKIKEREDILDDGDDEEDAADRERIEQVPSPASFYIGEKSANIITKSSSDKQSDLVDDTTDVEQDISQRDESISGSYDLQQDVAANVVAKRPSALDLVIEEDVSESSRTSARVQKLEDEEHTEYSHRSDYSADCDISKSQTTKVVHSPEDADKAYAVHPTDEDDDTHTESIASKSEKVVAFGMQQTNVVHAPAQRYDSFHSEQISEEFEAPQPQTAKIVHSPVEMYRQNQNESSCSEQISSENEAPARVAHSPVQSYSRDPFESSHSEPLSEDFSAPKAKVSCSPDPYDALHRKEQVSDDAASAIARVAHSPVQSISQERVVSFYTEEEEISTEIEVPKQGIAGVAHSPVQSYSRGPFDESHPKAEVSHSPVAEIKSDSCDSLHHSEDEVPATARVAHSPVPSINHERVVSFYTEEEEISAEIEAPQAQTAKIVHSPIDAYKSIVQSEETSSEYNTEHPQQANLVHSPVQSHKSAMHFDEAFSDIAPSESHRAEVAFQQSVDAFGTAAEHTETVVIEDMWPTSSRAKIIHSPADAHQSATEFEHPSAIDDSPHGSPQRANIVHSPIESVTVATEIEQTYSLHADTTDRVEQQSVKVDETVSSLMFDVESKRPPVVHSPLEPQRLFTDGHDVSEVSQLVSTLTDRSACESLDDIPSLPKRDGSSNEDSFNNVVHRGQKVQIAPGTRWSVNDPENCSSSGSHYDSFEKTDSRPVSSDVENLYSTYGGVSSDYQTARDASLVPGSTEYVTAASTLDHSGKTISSQDSMKSLDSDSSGQLVSLDVSEATETLVPSTGEFELPTDTQSHHGLDFELDENEQRLASLEACSGVLLEDEDTIDPTANMKRSHEMIFQADSVDVVVEKAAQPIEIAQSRPIDVHASGLSFEESKLVGSLEDGSQFSVSMTSTGNTIVENVPDDMASSFGSSLIGSYETPVTLRDGVTRTSFDDGQCGAIDSMLMTSSFVRDDDVSSVNTQITTTSDIFSEISSTAGIDAARRNRGHRRNDSTAFVKTLELKTASDGDDISLEDEMVVHEATSEEDRRESGSDSDYDRYETEYSRSFKKPTQRARKKKVKLEKAEAPREIERKKSIPSIETIVEDAEIEIDIHEERPPSQNMQDYSNIPDIMITDDPTKYIEDDDGNYFVGEEQPTVADEPSQAVEKVIEEPAKPESVPTPVPEPQAAAEAPASRIPIRPTVPKRQESSSSSYGSSVSINQKEIKISDEKYEQLIEQQYQTKLAEQNKKTTSYRDEPLGGADSPTSDSFEMVDVEQAEPDISDEFVIIEEVAKEADELMTEGKSVGIQQIKYEKKHDDEVEKIVVRSAPADSNEGSRILEGRHDMAFEFEDSPPNGSDLDENGLDTSRRWVEMELAEQAQNLRYPYDMERGVLEDIKEEDTDFEVGSSRISSFKDSYTGTPDYEALLARRYVTSKEGDTVSINSLQEFESLEQAISLENRRYHQGSADSSNGSFPRRFNMARSAQADNISLASLNEFEGLENACIEAHLLEIKAKEEHALLLSRSDESNKSNGSPNGKTVTQVTEVTDKDGNTMRRMTETTTTTVVTKASPLKITEERVTAFQSQPIVSRTITRLMHDDIDDELSSTNIMEVSTDSLELGPKHLRQTAQGKDTSSHHDSSDSLEISKSADVMTSSIDSIEISKDKSSKSDADSIEQLLAGREAERRDSIDSIDMQYALMSQATKADRDSMDSGHVQYPAQGVASILAHQSGDSRLITSTTSVASSSGYGGGISKDISSDSLCLNQSEKELMLTSSESLTTSSTNATYQNETDSQMSSSVTSCESTTLIDTLRTRGARYYDLDDDYETTQTTTTSTAYRTVTQTSEPQDLP